MITLTRKKIDFSSYSATDLAVWPLIVEASSDSVEEDANVFVYHAGEQALGDSSGIRYGDTFSNVASVQDMLVIPVGEPLDLPEELMTKDRNIPYYRTNKVELSCYNAHEAERAWDIIKRDVRALVRGLDIYNTKLSKEETVTYE